MRKKIHVTEYDILHGEVMDCNFCPIALACMREFNLTDVSIRDSDDSNCRIGSCGVAETFYIKLPRAAKRFIGRFDSQRQVKPFNFLVEIPDEN